MARQVGPHFITGTIDDITYYKRKGQYLARAKTSLDAKQFRSDPRFERSRRSGRQFGEGSSLASVVYRQLPTKAWKERWPIGKLTALASRLLREGKGEEEIVYLLLQAVGVKGAPGKGVATTPREMPHVEQQAVRTAPGEKKLPAKPVGWLSRWRVSDRGRLLRPRMKGRREKGLPETGRFPMAGFVFKVTADGETSYA